MSKLNELTSWLKLTEGVFIKRVEDALHIVTTGDNADPHPSESNIISKGVVSLPHFGDIVSQTAHDQPGKLVDVGTAELPLKVPQSQAPTFQALIATGGNGTVNSGELVNVGTDSMQLVITKAQAIVFQQLMEAKVGEETLAAMAEQKTDDEKAAATTKAALDATRIDVGTEFGYPLSLLPGDAQVFYSIKTAIANAAVDKLQAELAVARGAGTAPAPVATDAPVPGPAVDSGAQVDVKVDQAAGTVTPATGEPKAATEDTTGTAG